MTVRKLLHSANTFRFFIAALALLLALFIEWQRPALTTHIDENLRDMALRVMANKAPENRITIIDVNDASISAIGRWPWTRSQIADLVEILLGNYSAQIVGLDMVFPETADVAGDMRLAALAAHAPVVFAQIFDFSPRVPNLALGALVGGQTAGVETTAVAAQGFIANHQGLSAARCVGNIGYMPDADGVLRRLPVLTRLNNQDYPLFSATMLRCSGKLADPVADAKGFWRIPYDRFLSAYSAIPASSILDETAPRELIEGRYVIVGSSSLELGDRVTTPLTPLTAGVAVHAASLSALLDQYEGRTGIASSGRVTLLIWSLFSIAIAMTAMSRRSAWGNILILLGLGIAWLGIALWGINLQLTWSVSAPLAAYALLLLVGIPHEWWRSQLKEKRLIDTFSHYVAPPVLREILDKGLIYSLEPKLCEVSVLIADMEGYTQTTSSLSLQDAAQLTRDFLDCLTRPVLAHDGTLDKYSGDGLVAFWGAPLTCDDQADKAVSAAIDILGEVEKMNAIRQREGAKIIRVRIGIESGLALVGDLGTPFRSTYTAVGDCINFASRLESAARDRASPLLIGPVANSKLRKFRTHCVGAIKLRGTETCIEIFSLDNDTGTYENTALS